nr:immunoglobulin heavy chain junction region [Macaca mulatta]
CTGSGSYYYGFEAW